MSPGCFVWPTFVLLYSTDLRKSKQLNDVWFTISIGKVADVGAIRITSDLIVCWANKYLTVVLAYGVFAKSYHAWISLTHLPHFVIIISVPILWKSLHRSAFWSFTSAPGSVNLGGIGGSWRDGKIDEYGSESGEIVIKLSYSSNGALLG